MATNNSGTAHIDAMPTPTSNTQSNVISLLLETGPSKCFLEASERLEKVRILAYHWIHRQGNLV